MRYSYSWNIGIKFTRIGAPQDKALFNAAAEDSVKALDKVPESATTIFLDKAKELVAEVSYFVLSRLTC